MSPMNKPTFTPDVEAAVLAAIRANSDDHTVMPASSYRKDGSILVHRDNLAGVRVQRYLYRLLIGSLARNEYLRGPVCKEKGCFNPYHYLKVDRSTPPPTHCPNGHAYTPENTLPDGRARCRICYDESLLRKRRPNAGPTLADLNRSKTHCINGHEFTPENTYITYWHGRPRRRCRTCCILYAQRYRRKAEERKAS